MRAAAALAALLVLVPSTAAAAAARAIVLTTLFGEYHLVFDDARITEAEVRDLVVLSPHLAGWTSLAVAPRLERCVAGDSAYLDCARSTPAPRPRAGWRRCERPPSSSPWRRGCGAR